MPSRDWSALAAARGVALARFAGGEMKKRQRPVASRILIDRSCERRSDRRIRLSALSTLAEAAARAAEAEAAAALPALLLGVPLAGDEVERRDFVDLREERLWRNADITPVGRNDGGRLETGSFGQHG